MLSELNQKIKDDLPKILDGSYYEQQFSEQEILMLTKLSFLFNHIEFIDDSKSNDFIFVKFAQFKYNKNTIKINYYSESDKSWITPIMNEDLFKLSFKQFIRDYKISKLLC